MRKQQKEEHMEEMFGEDVINEDAIASLDQETLDKLLAILEKAGY